MKNSKLFKLNLHDFLKGLIVTFITALITGLYELIQAGGDLSFIALKPILLAAIAAGLAYIAKNLFTNSQGQLAKLEKKDK